MPRYLFEAIDSGGVLHRGLREATSEAALVAALQREGQLPVRTAPAADGSQLPLASGGRLRQQEVTDFTRELSVMLGAGEAIDGALRFLAAESGRQRVARVVERLRADLRDGSSLANALARHPASFSGTYVGLVRAGEAAGKLALTLDQLAGMLERERRMSATVQTALLYPGLLLLTAIGSTGLILGGVLPQFADLFAQSGAQLPQSTLMLMNLGNWVAESGAVMLILTLLGILAAAQAMRWAPARRLIDSAALRAPVLGRFTREVVAARLTRVLGTLLESGVPLLAALSLLRQVVSNAVVRAAIDRAVEGAREGAGMVRALRDADVLPLRTIHLLQLGEAQAQLGTMALRAAEIHEERVQRTVQRLVALLVPVITLVMGCIVAAIVVALLQAMLSLNDLAA